MDTINRECERAMHQGRSQDELLQLMHRRGLTITEAIKTCMKLYKLPLSEAKDIVSSASYWREIVEAASPLHDRLAEDAQDLAVSLSRRHEPRETEAEVRKRLSKRRKTK